MPQIDYFLNCLRTHGMKTIQLAGKYHLVAGLIRGREIFNLSTNLSHFHHAEIGALNKPCILQKKVKIFQATS